MHIINLTTNSSKKLCSYSPYLGLETPRKSTKKKISPVWLLMILWPMIFGVIFQAKPSRRPNKGPGCSLGAAWVQRFKHHGLLVGDVFFQWIFFWEGFSSWKNGGNGWEDFFVPNLWFVCFFFLKNRGSTNQDFNESPSKVKSIVIKQQLRIIPPKSKSFLEILRQTSGLKVVSFLLWNFFQRTKKIILWNIGRLRHKTTWLSLENLTKKPRVKLIKPQNLRNSCFSTKIKATKREFQHASVFFATDGAISWISQRLWEFLVEFWGAMGRSKQFPHQQKAEIQIYIYIYIVYIYICVYIYIWSAWFVGISTALYGKQSCFHDLFWPHRK